mgnify:CR=1 FL=1
MSLIFAMCLFSFSMSISPGPVNFISLFSGLNYGFKRTFPFVSGATIGFSLLLLTVGLGLYQILDSNPFLIKFMSGLGSLFIIYMGYKTYYANSELQHKDQGVPSFLNGFLMQWLNPKAWIACVSGTSLFMKPNDFTPLIMFCTLYFLICYIGIALWSFMGTRIQKILMNKKRRILFNRIMGSTLVALAIYLFCSQIF